MFNRFFARESLTFTAINFWYLHFYWLFNFDLHFCKSLIFTNVKLWPAPQWIFDFYFYKSFSFISPFAWIFKRHKRWPCISKLHFPEFVTCTFVNLISISLLAVNFQPRLLWIFNLHFHKFSTCTSVNLWFVPSHYLSIFNFRLYWS